jgi:hypothetical protein
MHGFVLGDFSVPGITFLECNNCGDKLFSPEESDKAIDFIADKEQKNC